MKFNVRPLDGGTGRAGHQFAFVDDAGVAASATCGQLHNVMFEGDGLLPLPVTDVNEAAEQVGRLLHRYRDYSLVVYAGGGVTARGDERTTADVYPPGRHPRINIEL